PRVVILNKKDLADDGGTKSWISKLEKEGRHPVAISARDNQSIGKMGQLAAEGTNEMCEKRSATGITGRAIRARIIGIPNVGKATIINNMEKKKIAQTGNTPGVTKRQQWIKAGTRMELLDTPGILWPKFEGEETGKKLSLTGAIKDTVVPL